MITLKNVLLVNALSSGFSGLLLMMMPSETADIFAVTQHEPFVVTGLFLLLFALMVMYAALKNVLETKLVRWIILLDVLWVMASAAIVVLQLFALSAWGYALISGVAIWVGLMAYLQHLSLSRKMAEMQH